MMIKKHAPLPVSVILLFSQLFLLPLFLNAEEKLNPRTNKKAKITISKLSQINFDTIESAIKDLSKTFPRKYPRGKKFLATLKSYKIQAQRMKKALKSPNLQLIENGGKLLYKINSFFCKALIANPLVSGAPILFVVRKQYRSDHHNTATMFQTGEINTNSYTGGGAMKIIDFSKNGESRVFTILDAGSAGVIRDPEVNFDGKKIIFSMRKNIKDDYHIYEISVPGKTGSGYYSVNATVPNSTQTAVPNPTRFAGPNPRQLTFAPSISDIDPLYLPDGNIVFTSTREPKFCMCNRHIMGNLFVMNPDGSNIHQVGKSTLHEGHSSLLPDGRILYDRWEYVDRNFGDAQGLWTVNPDGTDHALYWGNNTKSPGGVIDARAIPGTQNVLCIFGSCHDRPWGAVAIIDRQLAMDGPTAVVRTWPADAVNLMPNGGIDTFKRVNPKYEDPFPLNDKYFLVSRMTGHGEQMGIYLLDTFGNETLLHTEDPGCFDPMPLKKHRRPPVVSSQRNYENKKGYFYVQDVYRGASMKGVKRGAVKFLRVVESPEKRFFTPARSWGGQGVQHPGMNWHNFENKMILGTVPVESDGSAYFEVPSDTFVFFQLLDENRMMIQSMRSGTIIQSGETQGCVGCHESRVTDSPMAEIFLPKALEHAPHKLNGWYGKPRKFCYLAEVQPVFNNHCVKCHDFGKREGKILNLAPDKNLFFNVSYIEMWRKGFIKCIGAGPAEVQPAYSWGSHLSRLVQTIRKGHMDIKLTKEEMDRIVTWIDLNAPYYPFYSSAYPDNIAGRSPIDNSQLNRLKQLTGVDFYRYRSFNGNRGTFISFDRPEKSPCLNKFKDKNSPEYREAVSIIQAGKELLQKRPRADMKGFQPCERDRNREKQYMIRHQQELKCRKAIRSGKKVYDYDAKLSLRGS